MRDSPMSTGDVNKELLICFVDESSEALDLLESLFIKLESNPDDMETVNAIFRPIHSLKSNAAYFGLMHIKKLAHTMENLLDTIRKGQRNVDRFSIDALLPGVDCLKNILARVRDGKPELSTEAEFQAIITTLTTVLSSTHQFLDDKNNPLDKPISVHQGSLPSNIEPSKATTQPGVGKQEKTMRIPELALDDFLRCVGELLGVEELLRNLSRQEGAMASTTDISRNLKEALGQFEGISRELRTKIMEIRKVEARVFLQKTPRIVRDLAVQLGKNIQVICVGEEVKIDKSYTELLNAPLTHMVRNAVDHGIESPAQRHAAGKDQTGTLVVTIRENADELQLIVQDDGAGLNYDGLQKKAIALGLIAPEANLSKTTIVDLLFHSGVSTATEVTDVSGRGVGMDVVKKAVTDAGGTIDVESTSGIGTTFTISLPRNASTQIFDGYIVRSFSDELYVLPLAGIVEAFSLGSEDISCVARNGNVLTRRGTVLPLYILDTLLCSQHSLYTQSQHALGIGVLIEHKGKKSIIAVKEILGIQKVVCKTIEGNLFDRALFDGAAISGSGTVMLILNFETLLNRICI